MVSGIFGDFFEWKRSYLNLHLCTSKGKTGIMAIFGKYLTGLGFIEIFYFWFIVGIFLVTKCELK